MVTIPQIILALFLTLPWTPVLLANTPQINIDSLPALGTVSYCPRCNYPTINASLGICKDGTLVRRCRYCHFKWFEKPFNKPRRDSCATVKASH